MTEIVDNPARIAVLGAGSWGSTIAAMLRSNGHEVRLWCHSKAETIRLGEEGHPPGVPELKLPDVILTNDLGEAVGECDAAVFVVPAQVTHQVARSLADLKIPVPISIICSKGIDLNSLKPLSAIIEENLPGSRIGVVSGPCIAREVAQGIPTSVVTACADEEVARKIQHWFVSGSFRTYRQSDVLGVEYAGAYKNVIAIAAGIGDGLGFGANSKSALLTRGLAEMRRFVSALGGDDQTTAGLAGLGDLCVTCFSPFSRNRRFGEALGKGISVEEAIREIGETVEGVKTAEAVVHLAGKEGLDVPVADAVVRIVAGEWEPMQAVSNLMNRDLKEED